MFIWNKDNQFYVPMINPKYTTYKQDRVQSYESFTPVETDCICAIFAPENVLRKVKEQYAELEDTNSMINCVILTAGGNGGIRVFHNVF